MKKSLKRILLTLLCAALLCTLPSGSYALATAPPPAEEEEALPETAPLPEEADSLQALTRGAQMGQAELVDMPEHYKYPATERGRVICLPYPTAHEKTYPYAYVYLPYGYHPDNRYDIVYLMHGGGGSPGSFLNDPRQNQIFANMADHLIEEGKIRPMILVAPTFYRYGHTGRSLQDSWDDLNAFPEEFIENLIPEVEGRFSTYAETTDAEGIRASRTHRAFSGFSLGAVTTWEIFIHCMDAVAIYLPVSGDCWYLGRGGGSAFPDGTANLLADTVISKGYTSDDVLIYGFTGTKDGMLHQMSSQMDAMRARNDVFSSNLIYRVREDAEHLLVDMDEHLFYMFQDVFPAAPKMHP